MSHASKLKSIIPEEETKAYATWTRVPVRFFYFCYTLDSFFIIVSCSFFSFKKQEGLLSTCPTDIFFKKTTVIHTVETHETKKGKKEKEI
jgi:hypothetical protein